MIFQLAIAILATYRLALLLPDDEGPFFVFTRIRAMVAGRAVRENDDLGFWANIDSGINCAYCCGLYAAILVSILVFSDNFWANLVLFIFAVAGGQSILQKWGEQ